MKAVVAAFNQEKALVGAFSVVITNLRMEIFEALLASVHILAPLLRRPCEPAAKFTQGQSGPPPAFWRFIAASTWHGEQSSE